MMTRTSVRTIGALSLAAATLAGCSADTLGIANPNTPTVAGASGDPQSLQLFATGLLRRHGCRASGSIQLSNDFARELFP